jgi:hypothetical protein
VTLISAVFTQPFPSVPVTVYNVVADGVAITTFPERVFNPEAGPQVYVVPPVAVRVVEPPGQTVLFPDTPIVGRGFIVTVTCELVEHPLASVPVTV